jgi:hypothetical protein
MGRDSSFDRVTRLPGSQGKARDSSLLHGVQAGFGTYPTSSAVDIDILRDKAAGA